MIKDFKRHQKNNHYHNVYEPVDTDYDETTEMTSNTNTNTMPTPYTQETGQFGFDIPADINEEDEYEQDFENEQYEQEFEDGHSEHSQHSQDSQPNTEGRKEGTDHDTTPSNEIEFSQLLTPI